MRNLLTLCFLTLLCTCVSAQKEALRLTESVYFPSDGHQPDATEMEKLAGFAATLSSYAGYSLKVEAFTDEKGSAAYNETLAQRRAAAVTAALAANRITPAATDILTYGEQRAHQNTTDDAERQNDRRVDLVATVTRWENTDAAIGQARAAQRQTIVIDDPTRRQAIAGRKGGAFLVEANSFVRADGSSATGPVSVELIEAYDLSDMLIAGLTTTAASQRLVTGGMVSLTATDADGAALSLRTGASITAATPTDDFNAQMRIFSGADHNENGAPADWALTTGRVAPSADALFGVAASLPTPITYRLEAEENIGSEMYKWRQMNPEPKAPKVEKADLNFLSRKPVPPVLEEIVYEPKGLGAVFVSKAKRAAETEKLREKATATYLRHKKRYERALVRNEGMPARNKARQIQFAADQKEWQARFDAKKESLMTVEMRRLRAIAEERRERYEAARAERARVIGEKLAGLDDLSGQQANISRYFFGISKLGWTNVDIYHTSPAEEVQLLAKVPGSTPEATVVFVPTDRPSVIAYRPDSEAGSWKRGGIPRGIGYHVIAYQVVEGKLMMAHRFVDSASAAPASLAYQPVAITELQGKLAELLGS